MRIYRSVYVLRQNLSGEEAQEQMNKVVNSIEQNGGKSIGIRNFGLIKMAYQMDRNSRGHYFVMDFELDPLKLKIIRALVNINDNFLREIAVVLDKESRDLDKVDLTSDFKSKEKKHELIIGSSAFLNNLSQFVNQYGRILPRHTVGFSSKQMRVLARAIKRARYAGLVPFKADSFLKL